MSVYIPLNPDKTPAVSGWNKPEYRGVDRNDHEWIGLRADDLVIIDCDSEEAVDAWHRHIGAPLTVTYVVKTPRGFHFYYRAGPGSPTGPAVGILPSVDLRAGPGSYVVCPPSPGYETLGDRLLVKWDPAWMPTKPEKTNGNGEGWTKIPEGRRNDTLAAFAGTLRNQGMDAEEIGKSIWAMNKAYCDPPLPDDEVVTIARSIGRYEPETQARIVVLEPTQSDRATGLWGHELESLQAPPIQWIVPDLIPEGLTILAGKPKVGKSWMSLGLAAAVAEGNEYLGRQTPEGVALYLGLEDTLPRFQRRLRKIQQGEPFPKMLRAETRWPRCPDGAQQIVEWMDKNPDTKLVIVDTFAKIRHEASDRQRGTYQDDYSALADLKLIADHFHIAVVVVHHTRKAAAEDTLDEVSGTTGLSGAADTILVLKKDLLQGRGRDLEDDVNYDVIFNPDTCQWRILGDADWPIVLDLAAHVIANTLPGDVVKPELLRATGLWSQQEFERQWEAMHADPRFVVGRGGSTLSRSPWAELPA